jgi:hypothetical protein
LVREKGPFEIYDDEFNEVENCSLSFYEEILRILGLCGGYFTTHERNFRTSYWKKTNKYLLFYL